MIDDIFIGSVPVIKFVQALNPSDIEIVRDLFQEYANALGFGLAFQNFDKEIAELPGEYAPPNGRLYITYWNKNIAGCIALRSIDQNICEMKRMYVRPEYQGKGIMQEIIPVVIEYGLKYMRLHSIEGEVDPNNLKSIKLMEKNGFVYNRKLEKTVIYSLINKEKKSR